MHSFLYLLQIFAVPIVAVSGSEVASPEPKSMDKDKTDDTNTYFQEDVKHPLDLDLVSDEHRAPTDLVSSDNMNEASLLNGDPNFQALADTTSVSGSSCRLNKKKEINLVPHSNGNMPARTPVDDNTCYAEQQKNPFSPFNTIVLCCFGPLEGIERYMTKERCIRYDSLDPRCYEDWAITCCTGIEAPNEDPPLPPPNDEGQGYGCFNAFPQTARPWKPKWWPPPRRPGRQPAIPPPPPWRRPGT